MEEEGVACAEVVRLFPAPPAAEEVAVVAAPIESAEAEDDFGLDPPADLLGEVVIVGADG